MIRNFFEKDQSCEFIKLENRNEIKVISQIKLDMKTYTKNDLPPSMKKLKAIKPGSRNFNK